MSKVTSILKIPCVISEQYPKAFGNTVPELLQLNGDNNKHIYEKRQFSMMTDDINTIMNSEDKKGPTTYILLHMLISINITNTIDHHHNYP